MAQIVVTLSDNMSAFVASQVAAGEYADASEYIRGLIVQCQKKPAEAALARLLLDAKSEPARESSPEDWGAIRAEFRNSAIDASEAERKLTARSAQPCA